MLKKHIKKTQAGFTLIEIIAVLVILGILAAVAIPRFVDLQEESRNRAVEGALAAGASQLSMWYAEDLLTGTNNAAADDWDRPEVTNFNLGDFQATLTPGCDANISITGFPSGFGTPTANTSKTIKICE